MSSTPLGTLNLANQTQKKRKSLLGEIPGGAAVKGNPRDRESDKLSSSSEGGKGKVDGSKVGRFHLNSDYEIVNL